MSMIGRIRRITVSEKARSEVLKIEAPGCLINIRHKLTDEAGRRVVRIDVQADGDRYPDQPPWWIEGDAEQGETSVCVRIVEDRNGMAVVGGGHGDRAGVDWRRVGTEESGP